ncbi:MAG: hypothetical protein DRQ10_08075 [Candidatus Hydrothermota bacterium]|nr:MAG: hypothetical protein DRQ10_08075 [Candidatus Hydrothermae bacterium]
MLRVLFSLTILASTLWGGVISPEFKAKLDGLGEHEMVRAIVMMRQQADYQTLKSVGKENVAAYLRDLAQRSQKDVLSFLAERKAAVRELKTFWVINGFFIIAEKSVICELARRDDIGLIIEDKRAKLLKVVESVETRGSSTSSSKSITPIQWNIRQINADSVWALGYNGAGVLVGVMDTGIDPSHPALEGRFSGLWRDCINHNPTPWDPDSHGTHVSGIIAGGGNWGIGVAPGAQLAVARVVGQGGGYYYQIIDGFEWFTSLVSDSGYNICAVNGSWGSENQTSTVYWQAILAWRAVGIIPVFSIGNGGPGASTTITPANFPTVIGVGASDYQDYVSNFSSRGPAPDQYPWNDTTYWPRPDWNFIKPDIIAPGQGILSSVPNGGYAVWDGTSMSSPHVTGVIALLFSKNPDLDFEEVYNILTNTAYQPSHGSPYPNNNYGWGRVDALAAIEAVPMPTEPNVILIDYDAFNQNGSTSINPGDTINLVVYLTNTAATAQALQGVLRTGSQYATLIESTYTFGDLTRTDTLSNEASPFVIATDPATPNGMDIQFILHLETSDGYTWDYPISVSVGAPRSDYLDVHSCQATFTVTDNGALGFIDDNQSAGSGFSYRSSGNMLFYGTLAAGNSASYVVDNWYEHGTTDGDWQPTLDPYGRLYYLEPGTPPWYGSEQVWGMFDDAGHPTPQGLTAEMIAYGYDTTGYCGFIIVAYKFINRGSNTLDNLYFAWFIDFDISDYSQNYAMIDTSRRTAYMWGGANYAGIAIPDTELPIANLSVIQNQVYVYPDTGMVDTNQWHFMVGDYHFAQSTQADDWSVMTSVGPITLNPGDTVLVPFAIVGGLGLVDYRNNVDSARAAYYNPYIDVSEGEIEPIRPFTDRVSLAPTIVRGSAELRLAVPRNGFVDVRIYDATGRLVSVPFSGKLDAGVHSLRIADGLLNGVYFVRVKGAGLNSVKRMVVVR